MQGDVMPGNRRWHTLTQLPNDQLLIYGGYEKLYCLFLLATCNWSTLCLVTTETMKTRIMIASRWMYQQCNGYR